jgi:hypothetical protein
MQCTQCGAENVPEAQFCTSCGTPIASARVAPVPISPQPAPLQQVAYAAPPAAATQPVYPPQQPYAPQPAYPPQQPYTPVAQPVVATAPAPRKKRGCLVTALVLIGVMLLLCGAAAFAATALLKPKDLGVSYTEADYQSAVTKLGIQVTDTVPNLPVEKTKIVYKGKKQVKTRLTSAEVSAAVSMHHRSPRWALSDVQILLGDNNQAQMSGYAVFHGQRYMFSADITALLASPQTVTGSANNIVVFGVDFPRQYYQAASEYLIGAANDWLAGMGEGLDIQAATISGGELILEGTVPASAERVALDGVATGTIEPTVTP